MKFIKILPVFLLFAVGVQAQAQSVSYPIIGAVSGDSFSITINSIVKREVFDCTVRTFTCNLKSTTTASFIKPSLVEIKREDVTLRESEREAKRRQASTQQAAVSVETRLYPDFDYPKEARLLTLSPDKEKLAYFITNDDYTKTYSRYVLEYKDGKKLEKFILAKGWELITDNGKIFSFSEDGQKLVYLSDESGYQQLCLIDLSKNPVNLVGKKLILKPYTVMDFIVKGDRVYFIANREHPFKWGLFSLGLTDRKLHTIAPEVLYTNNLTFVGDHLLFTVMENGAGSLKSHDTKLERVNSYSGLPQHRIEDLKSGMIFSKDVKGYLLEANNSNKAIIWLHGGPYRQAADHRHSYGSYATYDWILDEQVRAGTSVLKLEYPGSFGLGRDHALGLVGSVGFKDVESVRKAVDYLKGRGFDEIYLFGNSYGGYLALKGGAEMSNRISGVAAVAPVTDWRELIVILKGSPFEVHFGGKPNNANEALYKQADVLSKLDNSTLKAILFHGELDRQVPFEQSEFLIKNLKNNSNVKYYEVKGQGHIISGVSQNEAICRELIKLTQASSTSANLCKME